MHPGVYSLLQEFYPDWVWKDAWTEGAGHAAWAAISGHLYLQGVTVGGESNSD